MSQPPAPITTITAQRPTRVGIILIQQYLNTVHIRWILKLYFWLKENQWVPKGQFWQQKLCPNSPLTHNLFSNLEVFVKLSTKEYWFFHSETKMLLMWTNRQDSIIDVKIWNQVYFNIVPTLNQLPPIVNDWIIPCSMDEPSSVRFDLQVGGKFSYNSTRLRQRFLIRFARWTQFKLTNRAWSL